MSDPIEGVMRDAWNAYRAGDRSALLALVHPDLEWTYLDPAFADPPPRTCHGRGELEQALDRPVASALRWDLEEVAAHGDRVLVVLHAPGLDQQRARQAGDRNYLVLTIREGKIAAMRACRSLDEARGLAGL